MNCYVSFHLKMVGLGMELIGELMQEGALTFLTPILQLCGSCTVFDIVIGSRIDYLIL